MNVRCESCKFRERAEKSLHHSSAGSGAGIRGGAPGGRPIKRNYLNKRQRSHKVINTKPIQWTSNPDRNLPCLYTDRKGNAGISHTRCNRQDNVKVRNNLNTA